MGRRIKVSLTIDESIVEAVDREAARGVKPNRSEVVERALRAWLREARRAKLDRAIEEYYLNMTPSERDEDEAWAFAGDEAAGDLWGRS